MTRIQVDFWSDCVNWMRAQLSELGHTPPDDAVEAAAHFLNLQRRRITPRPRTVSVTAGLVVPARQRLGYEELVNKMEAGGDLNPHLSRSLVRDANYDDALLNDWCMHHFHLGVRLDDEGFVERTDELVFAIVHWDHVFVTGVGVHGEWTAHRLIDAVHENWPHLLTPLALHPGPRLSPQEHRNAQRSNVWPVTVLADGTSVLGPGGGYATSGRSIRVSMRVIRTLQVMKELQARFMTRIPEIETHLQRAGHLEPPEFHLTTTRDGAYAAVDQRARVEVVLCTPEEARATLGV